MLTRIINSLIKDEISFSYKSLNEIRKRLALLVFCFLALLSQILVYGNLLFLINNYIIGKTMMVIILALMLVLKLTIGVRIYSLVKVLREY